MNLSRIVTASLQLEAQQADWHAHYRHVCDMSHETFSCRHNFAAEYSEFLVASANVGATSKLDGFMRNWTHWRHHKEQTQILVAS